MRLIHRGQMLIDDKKTLVDYHILETQVFIHCALSDPTIPTNTVVAKAKNTNTKLVRVTSFLNTWPGIHQRIDFIRL